MRRAAQLSSVVVLVVGLALIAPSYLTRDRDYVAVTPQPPATEAATIVRLPSDGRACMNLVALDERSEQARLRPTTARGGPVPLEITIRGEGYQARGRAAADWRDGETVAVAVAPPPRSLEALVCVHNLGRRPVDLPAAIDRSRSRSRVLLDGKPSIAGFAIQFYERRPASIVDRLAVSVQRMSVLRPGLVGPVTLWPLLVLLVAGVPIAALWAFARAVREDECRSEREPREPA
jgi:hypothetical protein